MKVSDILHIKALMAKFETQWMWVVCSDFTFCTMPYSTLGDLTPIFPTHIFKSITKFELLFERRPKFNIHVKYYAK